MKGPREEFLRIDRDGEDLFAARYYDGNKVIQEIGAGLSFDYAFSVATAFAEANRERFVIADLHAPWRELPASEKQLNFLRKKRFKNGLDGLTRGQVSTIIGSGAMNRGTKRI